MEKKSFIILLLFLIGLMVIVFASRGKYRVETISVPTYTPEEKMFLENQCQDLKCIATNFLNCQLSEYAKNGIRIAIFGLEEQKCHVRTINSDCYFPKPILSVPILNQLLGNNEGLESVVKQYCQ